MPSCLRSGLLHWCDPRSATALLPQCLLLENVNMAHQNKTICTGPARGGANGKAVVSMETSLSILSVT